MHVCRAIFIGLDIDTDNHIQFAEMAAEDRLGLMAGPMCWNASLWRRPLVLMEVEENGASFYRRLYSTFIAPAKDKTGATLLSRGHWVTSPFTRDASRSREEAWEYVLDDLAELMEVRQSTEPSVVGTIDHDEVRRLINEHWQPQWLIDHAEKVKREREERLAGHRR